MINRHEASLNMLEGQLKPNGIRCTKVIQTVLEIDRSLFIPEKYHNIAFSDVDIPLYDTYSIPKPLLASKLLQEMDLKKSDQKKRFKKIKKIVSKWDGKGNLVLVTHFKVINPLFPGVKSDSGEMIISSPELKLLGRIKFKYDPTIKD